MRPFDSDFTALQNEAEDIARSVGQQLGSIHLLLAVFASGATAEQVLLDCKVDEDKLLAVMQGRLTDTPSRVRDLRERAAQAAVATDSPEVTTLHLMLAICRDRDCDAYRMLTRAGADPNAIRALAMRLISEPNLIRGRAKLAAAGRARIEQALSNPGVVAPHAGASPDDADEGGVPSYVAARPPTSTVRLSNPGDRGTGASAFSLPVRNPGRGTVPVIPQAAPTAEDDPQERRDSDDPEVREARTAQHARRFSAPRIRTVDGVQPSQYALSTSEYPWLTQLGRNMSQEAAEGRFDPLIGRERELEELIDILGKRRSNNPLLVGEPGVGKTALVEGLSRQAVITPDLVPGLRGKVIVELDLNRVMAGTSLRGAFAERLTGLRDDVRRAAGRVIVFIDEIHTISGAGGDGPEEATNALKASLARGEFPCIGATTNAELKKFIESDPAFERRFEVVLVPEPSIDDTAKILRGLISEYESHHEVHYEPDALDAAAAFSSRYISERFLPDKALKLIDIAGSRARRRGKSIIGKREIADEVSRLSGVPAEKLLMSDGERLLRMETLMGERIIGHEPILRSVAKVIRRNYAGFSARRPIGSFLFLGPTGVGKTETAKALAEFMFGSPDAVVRLDMSEFEEQHAVSRLIGAPPGYVGHEAGGQLTEALRRKPFQIVLLDEVEKAHRDVLQILLQVLDEGRLTDGRGRTVDFTNSIIILTSNLGAGALTGNAGEKKLGFRAGTPDPTPDPTLSQSGNDTIPDGTPPPGSAAAKRIQPVIDAARAFFPPELWNRIEERLVFLPLERDHLRRICHLEAERSSEALHRDKAIRFTLDDTAVEWVLDHGGYAPELGARPLRQTLQRYVESPIAEEILRGAFVPGTRIRVAAGERKLTFTVLDA